MPKIPELLKPRLPADRYHSQIGQDALLDTLVFEGMRDGVFVDIGAYDGVTLSNSLVFEREYGWRCVCVEPNPAVFPRLLAQRPAAHCLNAAVSDSSGTMPFERIEGYSEMMSGLVGGKAGEASREVEREITLHGGRTIVEEVQVMTPAQVFESAGLTEVHILSVDVEGSEEDILRAIDHERTLIHVVNAECNTPAGLPPLAAVLKDRFDLAGRHRHDAFFINRDSPFHRRLHRLSRTIRRAALAGGLKRMITPPGRSRREPAPRT